jgi:hypothetical protein
MIKKKQRKTLEKELLHCPTVAKLIFCGKLQLCKKIINGYSNQYLATVSEKMLSNIEL